MTNAVASILTDILDVIEAHPSLAGWMQAVGAIASIWLTYYLASRESKLRTVVEYERSKDKFDEAFSNFRPLTWRKIMESYDSDQMRGQIASIENARKSMGDINVQILTSRQIRNVTYFADFLAISAYLLRAAMEGQFIDTSIIPESFYDIVPNPKKQKIESIAAFRKLYSDIESKILMGQVTLNENEEENLQRCKQIFVLIYFYKMKYYNI